MRDPRALADLTVPTLDVGSTLPEDLWTATPLLAQVRTAAHAGQVGAAGLLGALLARVSVQTHHTVELPATPNRGSLNLFVGLAAPSGMGKGSCVLVASRLLPGVETSCGCGEHEEGDYITVPTGTGEGLTRAFWESVRAGQARQWRRDRWHVLVDVDEIEALLAVSGRQGSTIGPVLRSLLYRRDCPISLDMVLRDIEAGPRLRRGQGALRQSAPTSSRCALLFAASVVKMV